MPIPPQAEILSTGASCQSPYSWGMGEGRSCTRLVFSLAAESPEERAQLQVGSSCPSPSIPMQTLTWHTRPPLQPGQANISVWPRPFPPPLPFPTLQWLQYPHTPACLNCAGVKHQPVRTTVTRTPVLAKSLVPLRGRGASPALTRLGAGCPLQLLAPKRF